MRASAGCASRTEGRQRGQALPPSLALKMNLADRLFFARIKQKFGGRLRFFVSGGAPLRREVAEFFHATGVLVLEGYGLTETTGATHVNRPDRFRFGTVGPAMPGCELRIAEDGEILIRGPGVMQAYHGLPEETAAVLDPAGWLATGDIGELRDGFLAITDRKKDLIITSGGKNIAPLPLEGRLELAEGIAHALVVGDGRPHLVALIGLDVPAMQAVERLPSMKNFSSSSATAPRPCSAPAVVICLSSMTSRPASPLTCAQ